MTTTRLCAAIIGDFDGTMRSHDTISHSLRHAAAALSLEIETRWMPTSSLGSSVADAELSRCDAIWCGPAGPYENADGALRAIQWSREHGTPFLGTCAGFQHAVIEYARNVMGLVGAGHAESHPLSEHLVIAPLAEPLMERTATVMLDPASRTAMAYRRTTVAERYRCRYGLNPEYLRSLHRSGLRISGVDDFGTAAVIELPAHPFFVGTLFMPERLSRRGTPHPLVTSYVRAAAQSR